MGRVRWKRKKKTTIGAEGEGVGLSQGGGRPWLMFSTPFENTVMQKKEL